MKEIILKVPSISCEGCEISIKNAFNGVKGIISVEPLYKNKSVKILYNETEISEEQTIKIIENTGREVIK